MLAKRMLAKRMQSHQEMTIDGEVSTDLAESTADSSHPVSEVGLPAETPQVVFAKPRRKSRRGNRPFKSTDLD